MRHIGSYWDTFKLTRHRQASWLQTDCSCLGIDLFALIWPRFYTVHVFMHLTMILSRTRETGSPTKTASQTHRSQRTNPLACKVDLLTFKDTQNYEKSKILGTYHIERIGLTCDNILSNVCNTETRRTIVELSVNQLMQPHGEPELFTEVHHSELGVPCSSWL